MESTTATDIETITNETKRVLSFDENANKRDVLFIDFRMLYYGHEAFIQEFCIWSCFDTFELLWSGTIHYEMKLKMLNRIFVRSVTNNRDSGNGLSWQNPENSIHYSNSEFLKNLDYLLYTLVLRCEEGHQRQKPLLVFYDYPTRNWVMNRIKNSYYDIHFDYESKTIKDYDVEAHKKLLNHLNRFHNEEKRNRTKNMYVCSKMIVKALREKFDRPPHKSLFVVSGAHQEYTLDYHLKSLLDFTNEKTFPETVKEEEKDEEKNEGELNEKLPWSEQCSEDYTDNIKNLIK